MPRKRPGGISRGDEKSAPLAAIRRPLSAPDHPDRGLDCQMYLEPAFQQVIAAAEAAGWEPHEVAAALLELALAHIAGREETARDEEAIARARRSPGHL